MPRPKAKSNPNQDPNVPSKARRTGPLPKDEARIVNEVRKRGACHECYRKKRKCLHTREQIELSQCQQHQQQQRQYSQALNENMRTDTSNWNSAENHMLSCQYSDDLYTSNLGVLHAPVNITPDHNEHTAYYPNVIINRNQIPVGQTNHAWTLRHPASHGPVPYVGHSQGGTTEGYTVQAPVSGHSKLQSNTDVYMDIIDPCVSLPFQQASTKASSAHYSSQHGRHVSEQPHQVCAYFGCGSGRKSTDHTSFQATSQPYRASQLQPAYFTPSSPQILSSSPPSSPSFTHSYPSPPKTPPFNFTSFLNEDALFTNLEENFEPLSPLSSSLSIPSSPSDTSLMDDDDLGSDRPDSPRTEDMSDLEYEFSRAEGLEEFSSEGYFDAGALEGMQVD